MGFNERTINIKKNEGTDKYWFSLLNENGSSAKPYGFVTIKELIWLRDYLNTIIKCKGEEK